MRTPSWRDTQQPQRILQDSPEGSQWWTCPGVLPVAIAKDNSQSLLLKHGMKVTSYGLRGQRRRNSRAQSLMESCFLGIVPEDLRYVGQLGIQQSQLSDH